MFPAEAALLENFLLKLKKNELEDVYLKSWKFNISVIYKLWIQNFCREKNLWVWANYTHKAVGNTRQVQERKVFPTL